MSNEAIREIARHIAGTPDFMKAVERAVRLYVLL